MVEIKTVAVIGPGSAGRGIAQAAALAGFRTILVDILPASLRQARSEMRNRVQSAVELGRLSANDADAALERLELAATVSEAAREADLVIEAVPDEMESKLEIFTLLDKISRPGTILASTTASLNLNEIASVTYRKPKILGMRFGSSAHGSSSSLQITSTHETERRVVELCAAAGRCMGFDVELANQA